MAIKKTEIPPLEANERMAPFARIHDLRVVVRDGWYNAFTDLACWKEMYWLCYRRGTSHGAGNSVEVVLRSNDLRRWREAEVVESPYGIEGGCAAADGHFCVTPNRLYLTVGTRNPTHTFVSWTEDGVSWTKPELMRRGDVVPYFWRMRWHEGRFYSTVNNMEPNAEPWLYLVVSDDAVNWNHHAKIARGLPPGAPNDQDGYSEESDLLFRADGELWCVIRTNQAQLYTAEPPYEVWHHRHTMFSGCDAPVMCETGGEVYLSGRAAASYMGVPSVDGVLPHALQNPFVFHRKPFSRLGSTGVYRLRKEGAELLITMPPAGDASYAGMISREAGDLVLSYYSDVAYASGEVRPRHFPEFVFKASECDIYLAEVEVGEHPKAIAHP
ncbi:MAG: hypothetical protein CMJ49_10800 [Planctomycetaceae bacterium]|nr:hypothetical protein [Planctomycetaceae bacterium]